MAGARRRAHVTDLFDSYVDARESGHDPNTAELLEQAGPHAGDLRSRIEVYESLEGMGEDLRGERELEGRLGHFEIRAPIGKGGLGQVYLAHDPELGREVAIKVLDRSRGLGRRDRAWTLNEARSLAKLRHDGVVKVFAVDRDEGRDFLVMEYLPGPSLAEVVAALRRLVANEQEDADTEAAQLARRLVPYSARTRCLVQLADALAYCHDRDVVHRDVKPSNVLFDREDRPRLIDFGLAHRGDTESETDITHKFIGTPAYLAPEQVSGHRTGKDPRSDQFSFATLAYELIALESPFEAETATSTLEAVQRARPRRLRAAAPTVPRDLERVIHHALERDPDDRYREMSALADDLRAVLEHRPVAIEEPSLRHLLRLWLRRERRRVIAVSSMLATLVAFIVALWIGDAERRRRGLLDSLDSLSVRALATPRDFERGFELLSSLKSDAAELDRHAGLQVLHAPAAETVRARILEWSEHLASVVAQEIRASAAKGVGFQHTSWRRIVDLERILCPDCEANREYRDRGRVVLPTEEELEGLDFAVYERRALGNVNYSGRVPILEKLDPVEYPRRGTYLLLAWSHGDPTQIVREYELVVTDPWAPPRRIELRRRDAALFDRSVRVDAARVQLSPEAPARYLGLPAQVRLPGYRILRDPVTREDIRRFQRATRGAVDESVFYGGAPEAWPAWVAHDEASRFAAWAGGRLPTILEFHQAVAARAIELPPPGEAAFAEWLAVHVFPPTDDYVSRVGYSTFDVGDYPLAALAEVPTIELPFGGEGADLGIGFRVVFTVDADQSWR